MTISAAQVKELRELTGAGMMDCKAALAETNGDMEAAVDWLRKKGIAKADKKAGRTAAEGLIGVDAGVREAVVVEVNSETDFVARNAAFQEIVAQRRQGGARPWRRHAKRRRGEVSGLGQVGRRHDQGRRRHHRREPELPPLGAARRRARRRRDLRPQRRRRQSRQARRAGRDRDDRQRARRARLCAPDRHACRRHQPAGADGGSRSIRRRSSARRRSSPSRPASRASRKRSSRRWSRAACASSTRRSCC